MINLGLVWLLTTSQLSGLSQFGFLSQQDFNLLVEEEEKAVAPAPGTERAEPAGEEELPLLIEEKSRAYGLNPELVLSIARCESQIKHYQRDGEILRGKKNQSDVGVFQINERYHLSKSRELGWDIYSPVGNVEYALWLIDNYGLEAWRWSKHCWTAID